jgi:hypothetical protein
MVREVIDEVEVVRAEIRAAKRRVRRHRESRRTRPRETRIERRGNRQRRCVGVVNVRHDSRAGGITPDDIHGVCVPGARGGGLAQEVQGRGKRDVHLLRVVAWEHEDVGCGCGVGQAQDGGLDGAEGRIGADEEGACGTARERVTCRVLACCAVERREGEDGEELGEEEDETHFGVLGALFSRCIALLKFVDYSRMANSSLRRNVLSHLHHFPLPSYIVVRQGSDRQSMLVEMEPSAGWAMRLHLVVPGVCGGRGGDDPPIGDEAGMRDETAMDFPETVIPLAGHLEVACPVEASASFGGGAGRAVGSKTSTKDEYATYATSFSKSDCSIQTNLHRNLHASLLSLFHFHLCFLTASRYPCA